MRLPEDLEREILSKLPSFDSAARLSCVCKSWYEWIKQHQQRVFGDKLSSQIRSGCPMVFHHGIEYGEFQITSQDNSGTFCPVNLRQAFAGFAKVVGECNGILCFRDEHPSVTCHPDSRLHLYNPITREYKKLPLGNYHWLQVFGFGFNKRSNDYEVIRIYYCWNKNVEVEIYKLSTNCWSSYNVDVDFGFDWCSFGHRVYANGSCYRFYTDMIERNIVCFDFEKETFGRIKNLPHLGDDSRGDLYPLLGVLHDSLALCSGKYTATDVWVLSEYDGVNSYWTKKFTLKLSFHIGSGVTWVHETHLFQFACYRLTELAGQEGEIGRTRMFKVNNYYRNDGVVFKPSLLSLSSGIFL